MPWRRVHDSEIDDDLVPDLSANYRAENSQPLRLWLRCGEGVVGVFDETALRPSSTCSAHGCGIGLPFSRLCPLGA